MYELVDELLRGLVQPSSIVLEVVLRDGNFYSLSNRRCDTGSRDNDYALHNTKTRLPEIDWGGGEGQEQRD